MKKSYVGTLAVLLCLLFTGAVFAATSGTLQINGTATVTPTSFRIWSPEVPSARNIWDENVSSATYGQILYTESADTDADGITLTFSVLLIGPGDKSLVTFHLYNNTPSTVTNISWDPISSPYTGAIAPVPANNAITIEWPDFSGVTIPPRTLMGREGTSGNSALPFQIHTRWAWDALDTGLNRGAPGNATPAYTAKRSLTYELS